MTRNKAIFAALTALLIILAIGLCNDAAPPQTAAAPVSALASPSPAASQPPAAIVPGAYLTRNGCTAIVDKTDIDGLRPVLATIKGDGPDYHRYYMADGREHAYGESPYDIVSRK